MLRELAAAPAPPDAAHAAALRAVSLDAVRGALDAALSGAVPPDAAPAPAGGGGEGGAPARRAPSVPEGGGDYIAPCRCAPFWAMRLPPVVAPPPPATAEPYVSVLTKGSKVVARYSGEDPTEADTDADSPPRWDLDATVPVGPSLVGKLGEERVPVIKGCRPTSPADAAGASDFIGWHQPPASVWFPEVPPQVLGWRVAHVADGGEWAPYTDQLHDTA
eukprot:gene25255-16366_t